MWSEKYHLTDYIPATLRDVLIFADKLCFPNIYTAFQLFATVPVILAVLVNVWFPVCVILKNFYAILCLRVA